MKNQLIERMLNNQTIAEKIENAETKQEVFAIAKEAFPEYTESEFEKEVLELKNRSMGEERITVEQLEQVAGGACSAIPNISNRDFFAGVIGKIIRFF